MVFQGAMNALNPVYTVGEQPKEVLQGYGFEGNLEAKIADSLAQVGLDPAVASRYHHELAGA